LDEKVRDLEFLHHYPQLKRFQLISLELQDASGLRHLTELEELRWDQTLKEHSLKPLEKCRKLRTLTLRGHSLHMEAVGTLTRLERLFLHCCKLDNVSALVPLRRLKHMDISLGSIRSLEKIPEIGMIQELGLCMIRGVKHVDFLARMPQLKNLLLRDLKHVRRLPSFLPLKRLKKVHLFNMNGIKDLRPVAAAPNLQTLMAWGMVKLQPRAFRPFVGHPKLRRQSIGLGSLKRNKEVAELLGVPVLED